jgi:hypothetical protein
MKNYYSAPKGFLIDPFNCLYQESDYEISQDDAIQQLILYGIKLEDKIEGDFDLGSVILEFQNNTFSFVRSGLLMYKVKAFKLYKKRYSNFKVFCKEALKVSHWQVNRIVEASRIVLELIQAGFSILPRNVAQCNPLSSYTGNDLIEKWQEIVENIPEHLITAKTIDNLLNPPEREEKVETTIKVPPALYLCILKKAIEKGMSVVELLEQVFYQKGANLHPDSGGENLGNLGNEEKC